MIRTYLTYMLTIVIALQSIVAMADTHQIHQSGTEHLTFDHKHQADIFGPNANLDKTDTPGNTPLECHHCCHCHGMAHFFLVGTQIETTIKPTSNRVVSHSLQYASLYQSPDNPPPIF